MPNDIVVDTNVLLHAEDTRSVRCEHSLAFLRSLLLTDTQLCIDEGFSLSSSENTSHIASEYLEHLAFGAYGLYVVAELARNLRVNEVRKSAPYEKSRRINQLIRKPKDRVFLSVAYNSHSKVLVSNDFEDFQAAKRVTSAKNLELV